MSKPTGLIMVIQALKILGHQGILLQQIQIKACCAVLCLVTQSFMTLCDPMDCSPQAPQSMGDLQARILEWVGMPSSRGLF